MSRNRTKAQKLKSLKIKKRILIVAEILVAICIIAAGIIAFVPGIRNTVIQVLADSSLGRNIISHFSKESFDRSIYDVEFNSDDIQMNDMEYNYSSEYTNFVLFGIDSRTSQFDEGTNSDSIVIVSVHNTTGKVKMISIYRDTFLRVYHDDGTYYYTKINAAYSVGGAKGAINTLNKNLDLQITDYVTVNFAGVAKIIDALGGIEVNLTEDELQQLNYHLRGTINIAGEYAPSVAKSGKNIHLTGIQATTYCRIRKATFYDPDTGDAIRDDFGRAARQRSVIMKLVEKAKQAGVAELTEMMNAVLNENSEEQKVIQTSFTLDEMIDMLPIIFNFSLEGSQGFPRKLTTGYINTISYVFAKGLERNVSILHEFLYGEEDYEPTSTVQEIDWELTNQSGIGEDYSDDDVDDTVQHSSDEPAPDDDGETGTEYYDFDDGGNSEFY